MISIEVIEVRELRNDVQKYYKHIKLTTTMLETIMVVAFDLNSFPSNNNKLNVLSMLKLWFVHDSFTAISNEENIQLKNLGEEV